MVYDAVIVGAGPAGSRAAWRLARAGARVALVDGSHPREKPCGGGVTGRALRLAADQLAAASTALVGGVAVERAVFVAGADRATVDLAIGTPPVLAIFPREAFDLALYEGALGAGAAPVKARVRDVEVSATRARARLERGGTIDGRVIIGADGANSLVRRRVLAPFSRADLSVATGFFVRGVTAREVVVEFETDPPGYLWSFPRADHLALGVCAQADRTSADALRRIAEAWIAREHVAGSLEGYSWPIPSLDAETVRGQHPAGAGWLLVGDAAGLVDPITREGIFFALASADLAADAIISGHDAGGSYVSRLRDDVLPELARAASLKAGFFRPGFMSLLVRSLQTSAGVRAVMADLVAGEQPYRTLVRRLLGTLEIGLAWQLLKMRRRRSPV